MLFKRSLNKMDHTWHSINTPENMPRYIIYFANHDSLLLIITDMSYQNPKESNIVSYLQLAWPQNSQDGIAIYEVKLCFNRNET